MRHQSENEGLLMSVTIRVSISSDTLEKPTQPSFRSQFDSEITQVARYIKANLFTGERVLALVDVSLAGGIAIDAIHLGNNCDFSMRRGDHFVANDTFEKPVDTLCGAVTLDVVQTPCL